MRIEPNAVQRRSDPMAVYLSKVPADAVVTLSVLDDCTGDLFPDLPPACPAILEGVTVPPTGTDRRRYELDFGRLTMVPEGKPLFLRATIARAGNVRSYDVRFLVAGEPCSFWQTTIAVFTGGECRPEVTAGLAASHWGAADLRVVEGDVRLFRIGGEDVRVPSTSGATGVAWLDEETLVFTASDPVDSIDLESLPGLYRVRQDGTHWHMVWGAPGQVPVAPWVLSGERVAFFSLPEAEEAPAELVLWKDGGEVERRPLKDGLGVPVRILGDREGQSLLTVVKRPTGPQLVAVQVDDGDWADLGWDPMVPALAGTEIGEAGRTLVEWEDLGADGRWVIGLWSPQSGRQVIEDLLPAKAPRLPAWNPAGAEFAYIED